MTRINCKSILKSHLSKPILVIGVAILIGGCSTTGNQVYQCCIGQTVTGDESTVSVTNVYSAGDAFPLAMNHCQKYKKTASFEKMTFITANFKCQ